MTLQKSTTVVRKTPFTLYLIATVIFYVISRLVFIKTAAPRKPNQTLYDDILDRDRSSLNLTSPDVPRECKAIVMVCSKLSDVEIRNTIRRTWANPLLSSAVRNYVITVFFVIGTGRMSAAVEDELQNFRDILQVNVHENYMNLVYKLLAAYRWIGYNYPDKFILKIDSDVIILLNKLAASLENPNEKTIRCHVIHKKKPDRNGGRRWYIPEASYPGYYLPDYCFGATYLFSPAALMAILDVSPGAKVIEVEDAFFTGVLATKADIKLQKERGMWPHWKLSQPCVNGESTVVSYLMDYASPQTLARSWHHLSNLRCRWPVEHFVLSFIFQD